MQTKYTGDIEVVVYRWEGQYTEHSRELLKDPLTDTFARTGGIFGLSIWKDPWGNPIVFVFEEPDGTQVTRGTQTVADKGAPIPCTLPAGQDTPYDRYMLGRADQEGDMSKGLGEGDEEE